MRRISGQSTIPLALRLGIAEGNRVFAWDAPLDYRELVEPLPERVRIAKGLDSDVDFVHVFVKTRSTLERSLRTLRATLRPDASVLVSWPKPLPHVETDLCEEVVRDVASTLGFADLDECSVDESWSGLKLAARRAP